MGDGFLLRDHNRLVKDGCQNARNGTCQRRKERKVDSLLFIGVWISILRFLDFNVNLGSKKIGNFDTELVEEFFEGFVRGGKVTLHIDQLKGKNTHHVIESIFKGFALALKEAVKIDGKSIPSTKGRLK